MTAARARRRGRDDRGFTLVELVVTMGLLLLVSAVLLAGLESVQRSEAFVRGRTGTLDEMRLAMSRVTKDVRQAVSVDPTSTADRLVVDTYVLGESQRVSFAIAGTDLTRQLDDGPAVVLLAHVADPAVFGYSPDVAGADVVTIDLVVHPPDRPDTDVTVSSEVGLRNRGTL